jgi:hypothetical protein
MPLLGALLTSLFGGLATWLAQFFARKVAISLAYVATLGTVTGVLLALMTSLLGPLASSLFSSSIFGWVGLAFPPIASTCIAAYGTAWAGCVLYSWQRESLRLAAAA